MLGLGGKDYNLGDKAGDSGSRGQGRGFRVKL